MKTATAMLASVSPYSQSKHYMVEKLEKEGHADYEKRTWRERCNVTEDGKIYIPPMAFKNCLAEAAQYLSIKIPGKRNATWTKHFLSGVLVTAPLILPTKKEDVIGEWFFVPSDGKKNGGSRVDKCFPMIREWSGAVTFYILDETITQDAFKTHLEEAGKFIGIGRFRPRNGGFYGRFELKSLKWS